MYQIPIEYDSNTVEPPNKGHFGANINSDVVSFLYRAVVLTSEVQKVLEL